MAFFPAFRLLLIISSDFEAFLSSVSQGGSFGLFGGYRHIRCDRARSDRVLAVPGYLAPETRDLGLPRTVLLHSRDSCALLHVNIEICSRFQCPRAAG